MTRQQKLEVNSLSIGVELQRHRKAARITLQRLGQRLGMSPSLLSRLETGKRDAIPEEVSAILAVIGVDREERERLIAMAKGELPAHVETHSQAGTYRALERRAATITNFEPLLVPGLAQIPDYSRAVVSVAHSDEADIEERVRSRKSRQEILARSKPPRVHLVVTELAMRQPVGGRMTMARQLRHLVELAGRSNVSISVVPIQVATHGGLLGQFVVLGFADSPTIVFVEDRTTGLFLDDPVKVAPYKLAMDKLVDVALDVDESVALLSSIADDMEVSR